MKKKLLAGLTSMLFILSVTNPAHSSLIFDNSAVNVNNTTWNATSSPTPKTINTDYEIIDEFSLSATTQITDIVYEAWHGGNPTYVNTYYAIYDSLPITGSSSDRSPLLSDTVVATFVSNGLTSALPITQDGFTHTIADLSITLGTGTYFLGVSINEPAFTTGGFGIGSGDGTAQTIGTGLYQYYNNSISSDNPIRFGDHMSFSIYGETASVPEPATMFLFGTGLAGLFGIRRRKKA